MPSKDYARETVEAMLEPLSDDATEAERLFRSVWVNAFADIIQRLAVEPARREGAEEMRERAASYCDDMRNGFIEMGDYEDQVADFTTARDDIRALPIDPPPEREPEEKQ